MIDRLHSGPVTISRAVHHTVTVKRGERLTITSTGRIDPRASGATGLVIPTQASGANVLNQGIVWGATGAAGSDGGIGVDLMAGSLNNAGRIYGGTGGYGFYRTGGYGGVGVVLATGAALENAGLIRGGDGGRAYGNGGYSGGTGGIGVVCDLTGGSVSNSGTVEGGRGGDAPNDGFGGYGGAGVDLAADTIFSNTGTIIGGSGGSPRGSGGVGVYLNGGTLVNGGLIAGGSDSDAVQFGTAAATLVVDAGAVFDGTVAANASVNDVLELGGTAAGSLSGLGTQFTGFTTMTEDAGATWTLSGANTIAASTTLLDSGNLNVTGTLTDAGAVTVAAGGALRNVGTLSFLGVVTNNGMIDAPSGLIGFASAVAGTGTLEVGAMGTLSLLAGSSAGQTVDFLAGTGLMDLTQAISFDGYIDGFGAGDQIDLVNTAETSFHYAAGVLTVKDGTASVASLHFTGSYTTGSFTLMGDHHGGTLITFN